MFNPGRRDQQRVEKFFSDQWSAFESASVAHIWSQERGLDDNRPPLQVFEKSAEEVLEAMLACLNGQPTEIVALELVDVAAYAISILAYIDNQFEAAIFEEDGSQAQIREKEHSRLLETQPLNGQTWKSEKASIYSLAHVLYQLAESLAYFAGLRVDNQKFKQVLQQIIDSLNDDRNLDSNQYGEPKLKKNVEKRLISALKGIFIENRNQSRQAHLNGKIELNELKAIADLFATLDAVGNEVGINIWKQLGVIYASGGKNWRNYKPEVDYDQTRALRDKAIMSILPPHINPATTSAQEIEEYYLSVLREVDNDLASAQRKIARQEIPACAAVDLR